MSGSINQYCVHRTCLVLCGLFSRTVAYEQKMGEPIFIATLLLIRAYFLDKYGSVLVGTLKNKYCLLYLYIIFFVLPFFCTPEHDD